MAGNFVWTLTATDILTQWTEVQSMWNRGAATTCTHRPLSSPSNSVHRGPWGEDHINRDRPGKAPA